VKSLEKVSATIFVVSRKWRVAQDVGIYAKKGDSPPMDCRQGIVS